MSEVRNIPNQSVVDEENKTIKRYGVTIEYPSWVDRRSYMFGNDIAGRNFHKQMGAGAYMFARYVTPCGLEVEVETFNDFPTEDESPCRCGDPFCFEIRWLPYDE